MADEISEQVTELREYARRQRWWDRLVGSGSGASGVSKYPKATQLAIGGVSGVCAGCVFKRVGKVAAMSIGGGLLLLPVAYNSGYIKVDWKRVEKDIIKAKEQLHPGDIEHVEVDTFVKKAKAFMKQNIYVTSGFIGGFLIGMAS